MTHTVINYDAYCHKLLIIMHTIIILFDACDTVKIARFLNESLYNTVCLPNEPTISIFGFFEA